MGRYANYHIALMLSLIYGPPMLLCAVYLYFHKKEQNALTINGSLLGGIKKSQWRHNLLHAPDSEFRLLYKIERRVFRKLCRVIGSSKTFKKYRLDVSILPILIFLKKGYINVFAVIKIYSIQTQSLSQTLDGLVSLTP